MKDHDNSSALDTTRDFKKGTDLSDHEAEILKDIKSQTEFQPETILWKSSYWGTSQIGATHYTGIYEGKPAVLKIQGVKPNISETEMIEQFSAQNRSKIIRPPHLFISIPWNDTKEYEALLMEQVTGKKVLNSKQLQTIDSINKFYTYYSEYRKNALPNTPWLPQSETQNYKDIFAKLIKTSHQAYPQDPRRKPGDETLAYQAAEVLNQTYTDIPQEFVHGHFSAEDLIHQDEQVVIFSNLFWKWKYPFQDAVFAYHWAIYELEHIQGITPEQVESQRQLWLSSLLKLTGSSEENIRLLKAALLERAVSGVILDSFLVSKEKHIAVYLSDATREQIRMLMNELS